MTSTDRKRPFILASTSPRRHELFGRLGVAFTAVEPPFEEVTSSLEAGQEALTFAEGKARSVAANHRGSWVLAADTLIECDGDKLGKPRNAEDARRILSRLSGKTHRVHTAVVLIDTESGKIRRHLETARVRFRDLSDVEIRDYVATGEPMGKAGAYAMQGRAGKIFIEKIEGDEEAVIGLPVAPVKRWLEEIGLISV